MIAARRSPRLVTACLAIGFVAACGRPQTDIVATSTEDVGHYDTKLSVNADAVTGQVCVDAAASSDQIVRRVLQQLANHSYARVVLDVYAGNRPLARYQMISHHLQREPLSADATGPCAPVPAGNEGSAER